MSEEMKNTNAQIGAQENAPSIAEKLVSAAETLNSADEEAKARRDEELKKQTARLKNRLREGEGLDDILPDAFAVVREADVIVVGGGLVYVIQINVARNIVAGRKVAHKSPCPTA